MSRREFLDFVLEQMSLLRGLRSRTMFGGFGIYCDDHFFGLIADDRLYLKTDDVNRGDFTALGLGPFVYGAEGRKASLQYYEAPAEVYEDREAMKVWAGKGIAAAQRAAALRRKPVARPDTKPNAGRSKSRRPRASGRAARRP